MAQNKQHWYDGWFYDKLIAPNQDRLFGEIKSLITDGSKVIDIGCGTGRLSFTLTDKCDTILGIDLSETNIRRANHNLSKKPDNKITFRHASMLEIISKESLNFDYAVLTYVIHEVDEDERIILLQQIASVSDKIIIGDYLYPRQHGLSGWLSKAIEFIAGREHYRNYKSYMASGGTRYLADKAGLKITYEEPYPAYNNHIVILSR